MNREDWERACAYKRKLAHLVTDPEQHFTLLVETGDLWAKHAQNMPMAALAYEEALAMRPRDPGLLHTLLWLYGELACWEKLVETLRTLADMHADPLAKAKSVYAMAMVVRDHLSDLPAAAVLLEEVLDLDDTRLDAFERACPFGHQRVGGLVVGMDAFLARSRRRIVTPGFRGRVERLDKGPLARANQE